MAWGIGKVNKLKLIKRMDYGRAGFALLRKPRAACAVSLDQSSAESQRHTVCKMARSGTLPTRLVQMSHVLNIRRFQVLSIHPIPKPERSTFYDMLHRYLLEIAPQSPEVDDLAKDGTFFEEEFPFGKSGSSQWWAQVDHHKIGFAQVMLSADGLGHTYASITDFYIEPAWRRQRYSRAFVEALRTWMKSEGVCRIDLSVRGDTPGAYASGRLSGSTWITIR
jgi:GNAT superfamily N-acetyltransferase